MIGNEFADTVRHQTARMTLFGEVVSAIGFGTRDLFIQYLIEFPSEWSIDVPIENLSGLTQDSRPLFDRDLKMHKAAFSSPMEAVSIYQGPGMLKSGFHVSRVDSQTSVPA